MNNTRMLQRNGRVTGMPVCGAIPHYDRREAQSECGCARQAEHVCKCDTNAIPIAISSIAIQKWCEIYDLEEGFCAGTIFRELDLPFCGMRGGRL